MTDRLYVRPAQIDALAAAMWQLLDDMGCDGQCVCLQAKAEARIAFEPFITDDMPAPAMTLVEAELIAKSLTCPDLSHLIVPYER